MVTSFDLQAEQLKGEHFFDKKWGGRLTVSNIGGHSFLRSDRQENLLTAAVIGVAGGEEKRKEGSGDAGSWRRNILRCVWLGEGDHEHLTLGGRKARVTKAKETI